ncbi:uncharacterized protein LOC134653874 [Cydia amplana]|uniref:uncharacterized protein LOC134653874 n=1 Tax=Cydia amplana TaxID=1869771 RepID=UPI002FE58819
MKALRRALSERTIQPPQAPTAQCDQATDFSEALKEALKELKEDLKRDLTITMGNMISARTGYFPEPVPRPPLAADRNKTTANQPEPQSGAPPSRAVTGAPPTRQPKAPVAQPSAPATKKRANSAPSRQQTHKRLLSLGRRLSGGAMANPPSPLPPLPPRLDVLCYADDTLVTAKGSTHRQAVLLGTAGVAHVVSRIRALGLEVALNKSEALCFHGPRNAPPPGLEIVVGGTSIAVESTMRYLGIVLDGRWSFTEHFARKAPKLLAAAGALGGLLPNTGGPGSTCRRLYQGVVRSMALYGAPIWAESLNARNVALLRRPQRVIATRAIRAYRTVSLQDWLERERGSLTFRLVQVLTGHGCFGSYLHRYARREVTAECHQCGCGEDTAQHTLEECPAWEGQRRVLAAVVGNDLSLPAVVKAMVADERSWKAVLSFCEDVMSQKEAAEREREANPASHPIRRKRTGARRRAYAHLLPRREGARGMPTRLLRRQG